MANMAGKLSEVKMWGTGKTKTGHREHREEGRAIARRDFRRTVRREGRALCKAARFDRSDD